MHHSHIGLIRTDKANARHLSNLTYVILVPFSLLSQYFSVSWHGLLQVGNTCAARVIRREVMPLSLTLLHSQIFLLSTVRCNLGSFDGEFDPLWPRGTISSLS